MIPKVSHCINVFIVQLSPFPGRLHCYNAKAARKVGKYRNNFQIIKDGTEE